MYKRRVEHRGRRRRDTQRFPYEPILVAAKVVMLAELQKIHRIVLAGQVVENVSAEMRAVVERIWPELGSQAAVQDSVLKWTTAS